jgi:hypothetical protein
MSADIGTTPTGYTGASLIQMIRDYTSEYTYPNDQAILNFSNKGVEEVVRLTGGIRLWYGYPTENLQTTIQLNNDVLDIVSANFSMGNANSLNNNNASPFAQGTLVYPMMALEQAAFMDAAAGFPAVGFGPPQAYFIYQDSGQSPSVAIPAPSAPQLAVIPVSGQLEWNINDWNQNVWAGSTQTVTVEVGITYTNAPTSSTTGETTLSPVTDVAIGSDEQVQVQSPAALDTATGYNVYAGYVGGPYFLQNDSPIAIGTAFDIPPPFQNSGSNPPTTNTTGGFGGGGSLFMQLYPAAMVGQVNVYYRARPLLWADSTDQSFTNLDTSAQEAVVLFAVQRVLMNRGRGAEVAPWKQEYTEMIASLKESLNRRTTPKSGQVRDVANRSYPSSPWWTNSG